MFFVVNIVNYINYYDMNIFEKYQLCFLIIYDYWRNALIYFSRYCKW